MMRESLADFGRIIGTLALRPDAIVRGRSQYGEKERRRLETGGGVNHTAVHMAPP